MKTILRQLLNSETFISEISSISISIFTGRADYSKCLTIEEYVIEAQDEKLIDLGAKSDLPQPMTSQESAHLGSFY